MLLACIPLEGVNGILREDEGWHLLVDGKDRTLRLHSRNSDPYGASKGMSRKAVVEVDGHQSAKLAPGSPEAAVEGCTCSQARNKFGDGVRKHGGRRWYRDPTCPIHGKHPTNRI